MRLCGCQQERKHWKYSAFVQDNLCCNCHSIHNCISVAGKQTPRRWVELFVDQWWLTVAQKLNGPMQSIVYPQRSVLCTGKLLYRNWPPMATVWCCSAAVSHSVSVKVVYLAWLSWFSNGTFILHWRELFTLSQFVKGNSRPYYREECRAK